MTKTKPSVSTKVHIETTKVPKGIINTIKERCKGCEYCVSFCPKGVLEMSKEYNRKGYHFPLVKTPPRLGRDGVYPVRAVAPQQCTGCNLCGLLCPDLAIYFAKSKSSKGC